MRIKNSFYLSDENNIEKAIKLTNLALDEIELIVGRFANHSRRAKKLRGEVVITQEGQVLIRHHFHKKILWQDDSFFYPSTNSI